MIFRYLLLGLMLISGCQRPAFAYTEQQAVLAIIGEAEGEPYMGKVAIGCAIRNRKTLKEVYGLNAPRVKQRLYSQKTYREAQQAWKESERKDITKGSTHWEAVKAFGEPWWAKSMIKTIKVANHQFYKEK